MMVSIYPLVMARFMSCGSSAMASESTLFRCLFDWPCDPNRTWSDATLDLRIRHDTDTDAAEGLAGNPPDRSGVRIGDRRASFLANRFSGTGDGTTIGLRNGEAANGRHRIGRVTLTPMQYPGDSTALRSTQ